MLSLRIQVLHAHFLGLAEPGDEDFHGGFLHEGGVEFGDGTTLGVVGGEEVRAAPATEGAVEFPGEVVGVLDSGIEAVAARGGELVGYFLVSISSLMSDV